MRALKSEVQLDDNLRYELMTRLDGMPKHTKLCHGDFDPSNIIVGNDGKWYVVDWVHASQGNASADVARTYLLLSLKDKRKLRCTWICSVRKQALKSAMYRDGCPSWPLPSCTINVRRKRNCWRVGLTYLTTNKICLHII